MASFDEIRPNEKNKGLRSIANSTPVRQILSLLRRQPQEEQPDEEFMIMPKALFVSGEASGVALNEHGEPTKDVDKHEAKFDTNLVSSFEVYLRAHLTNLAELKGKPAPPGQPPQIRTMFDFVTFDPSGETEARLYKTLIGANGLPDDEKIEAFLKTAEGWMLTKTSMDQQRAFTLFAGAMDSAARNGNGALLAGGDNYLSGGRTIRMGSGQGAIDRWWHNKTHDQQRRMLIGTAGALVAGVAGAVAGPAIGVAAAAAYGGSAALGGVVGGVGGVVSAETAAAAIAGLVTGLQRGNVIQLDQCKVALEYMQANPVLAAKMKYMSGMDVRDYHINGAGVIELDPARVPETKNLTQNLETAVGLGYASQRFSEGLGIDPYLIDSSREEFITHGVRAPEQVANKLEQRAWELLDVNSPATDWAALTPVARLQKFHEAQRKAQIEMFEKVTTKLLEEKSDAEIETSLEQIDRHLGILAEGGEAERNAKKPLEAEKAMLQEVNEGLGRDAQTMEAYQQAVQDLQQARERVSLRIGSAEVADIQSELNSRAATPIESIQQMRTEVAALEAALQKQIAKGEAIDNRLDAASNALDRMLDIDARLAGAGLSPVGLTIDILRSEPTEAIIKRINKAQKLWGNRMPPLAETWGPDGNLNSVNRTGLYLKIAEARARENTVVSDPTVDLESCRLRHISENLLRTSALPEIVDRLNAAHGLPVDALRGLGAIPVIDLNNPTHRLRLEQLVTEAQTRFSARASAFKATSKQEVGERDEFNAEVQRSRAQIETDIQRDRTEMTSLQNEETNLNNLRNLETQAATLFGRIESEYVTSFDQITNWHNQLKAQTPSVNDLDPDAIRGYTTIQLRDILNVNGKPLPTDPSAAERFLVSVISEAQARKAGGPDFTKDTPGGIFAATINISERQLRDWNEDQLDQYIRRYKYTVTPANMQEMKSAHAELQSRQQARIATLVSTIKATGNEATFLRVLPEYATAETQYNNHLARLGVANRGALQTRIDKNVAKQATLRELNGNQVADMLAGIVAEEEAYGTAVENMQTKRNEVGKLLDDATTAAELKAIIDGRNALPTADLEALQTIISRNEQVINSGQAVEQYYTNAREFFARLTADPAVTALYAPGREINEANLRTLPLQEIMTRMNEVHALGIAAGIDVGWPPEQNNRPENRMRLARTIENARWEQQNRPINPDFGASVLGTGMPENLVLSMTPQEAIAEINRRAGLIVLDPALPASMTRVEAFRRIAQTRLNNRVQTLNTTTAENTYRTQQIDTLLTTPDAAIAARRAELEEMKNVIKERGARMAEMGLFALRPRELSLTNPVGADPDLTPAENALAGEPRGMIEMYDILFQYKKRPDRQVAFQAIQRVFAPDRLRFIFGEEIPTINLPGAPADSLEFINRLRVLVERNLVTSHELNRVVARIATEFQGRALALTA